MEACFHRTSGIISFFFCSFSTFSYFSLSHSLSFSLQAAVNGIAYGLAISFGFAFVGLWLFTGNLPVAVLACFCLTLNVFFMLAFYLMMGWTMGIIEAVRKKGNEKKELVCILSHLFSLSLSLSDFIEYVDWSKC
jgi:hypothetical protein